MSRNGSGVYTKVNTFVSGNTVTAAGHNQNWDDLATEMTNSVAADGQTSLTGALKAASGTVGAPGVTFASDPDSGLYRIGSNNIGVAVNGAKVLDVATTGLGVTGDMNATTVKQAGFNALLVGEVKIYAGLTAPSGYLFCYGQAVSRTTYSALFAILSTTYGGGDGSTTFNLPDLRGRVVAGQDDMGGSSANRLTGATNGVDGDVLGGTGGEEAHTLTQAQLPNVNLSAASLTATTSLTNGGVVHRGGSPAGSATAGGVTIYRSVDISVDTITAATVMGGAVPLGGSGTALNVVQPTIVLNYIVYAGV